MTVVRYTFHDHKSALDLAEVVAIAPQLAAAAARTQGEDSVEDAIAFVLDVAGADHVHQQRKHLEVVLRRWAYMAPRARSTNDQERVRAIPERLAWRFDAVWPEGRAVLHLMLRAVMIRTGCAREYAPMCVEDADVDQLLEALQDGLRAGFAASLNVERAVELLEARQATMPAATLDAWMEGLAELGLADGAPSPDSRQT